jgi:aspartate dehydrogenase
MPPEETLRPRLVPLEPRPIELEDGSRAVMLHDPMGVLEGAAVVSPAAYWVLAHFDGARALPEVVAALALAGVGPVRTRVEVWADPTVTRNVHTIRVVAESASMTMTIENVPSLGNPRTGRLAPLSVLACLRGMVSPLKAGS